MVTDTARLEGPDDEGCCVLKISPSKNEWSYDYTNRSVCVQSEIHGRAGEE
jgi:hypothetical protein